MDKERIREILKTVLQFLFNPQLLLCLGVAWIITNGWSYILFALGSYLGIGWMIAVSSAYIAFLWFPCTPEKIVTLLIAMFLLKRFFPHDEKTLKKLTDMHARHKKKHLEVKNARKNQK